MTVAVYVVLLTRLPIGVNVAVIVVALYATEPLTDVPLLNVNDAVIVEAFMISLNVAVTDVFTATPVAPLAGLVDETVGAVASGVLELEPLLVVVVVLAPQPANPNNAIAKKPIERYLLIIDIKVPLLIVLIPDIRLPLID